MLIRVSNFFEFEQISDRVNQPLQIFCAGLKLSENKTEQKLYPISPGWTDVNLLYFLDSIEIASVKGLSLCCSETNQSKQLLA